MNLCKSTLFSILVASITSLLLLSAPLSVRAGCGCQKTPPPPAVIFPNATYAGMLVTLFHSDLVAGQSYDVAFTAMNGQSESVSAQAVSKRDLSDGQYKPQLVVSLPALPFGPTSIAIHAGADGSLVTTLDDTLLTVVPAPVVVPAQLGKYHYKNFQAAVGRDGTVYLSLDMTQVQLPMVFQAQAKGYPLRFANTDVVFYNTQGFPMQTLTQGIPGLYTIQAATTSVDSDTLRYSRHEFATYFLQHGERQTHQLDPTDANWHQDGTYHVDHNHLVLALAGHLSNGALPTPGATPAFELALNTYSFFQNGLVGAAAVSMTGTTLTESYTSRTGFPGIEGDVLSNGALSMSNSATINGDATAASLSLSGTSRVNGAMITATQPITFLAVAVPIGLTDLGSIKLPNGNTRTLGPGSYKVKDMSVSGGQLVVDNVSGPVTLYVTGQVSVSSGQVTIVDPNPEKFALYVASTKQVSVNSDGTFAGVIYAPRSVVTLTGKGQFRGSFVGRQMKLTGSAQVRYDTALRGEW